MRSSGKEQLEIDSEICLIVQTYQCRHVIHTTLIAFYDLISKTDTTVTKCDFTVNHLVSIFLAKKQILNSSVARS